MIARIFIATLALGFGAAMPIVAFADSKDAVVREEELAIASDDDDKGAGFLGTDTHDSTSFTSGVDSNDGTGSRHTPVTMDRDRSRGDLTKDQTRDGPGGKKRDMSRHKTNDRSRHDTR